MSDLNRLNSFTEIAKNVKRLIHSIDPEARVYLFGSVVRGHNTALSDIDILVITSRIERKYDMMVKVYKNVRASVELHIVTNELYENWYKRFIPPEELREIT
ncbi:MAG: nucleotidyltransferase domain-containing protein [Candidatus Methanomethylicaceae archaeon]